MRAFVIVLVAGCTSGVSGSSQPLCHTGDRAVDDAMFAQLTANKWGVCNIDGFCLELDASGDYATEAGYGDYSVSARGRWNFLARDATSGLACLNNGSVIDFAI